MKPIVAAKTDVGRVRQGNEDSYLVEEPIFAVADGMGGHIAGDIASATAVEVIEDSIHRQRPSDTGDLAEIVRRANSAIWEKAQGDSNLRGMGTTCTLLMLDGGELHIAHVGDSRAYLYRAGELSQLTEDHTLVSRMVREGRLQPEEAERHPQRSIITRALGVDSDVEVDELSMGVEEGDRYLICSDGLTSMIDTASVQDVLKSAQDPNAAVEQLVQRANDAGGEDNVTVVLVDIASDDARTPAAAPSTTTDEARVPRETTEPDAAPPPPAVDTGVHRIADLHTTDISPRRRGIGRALAWSLLIVVLLAGGAYAAGRYTLANSYFVGADDSGRVTIYRGIPEEIVGLSLKESEESTHVSLQDLPDFIQGDVEEGIKAESLQDARDKVADLQERAQDRDFDKTSGASGGKDN
ncbi:MAG TPA: Stp1/IreP family PP2C-type Ser/Thr phosphatase [Actinomycetota bacterium]|nr:Stp1/IreP family PP2C-type Ser/Thr phosphatase [Actinomycetota bacterium]